LSDEDNGMEKKLLDGKQEAKLIAIRLGDPPERYGNWTLRLLRDQVVELGIVESISHETVRQTLKKTGLQIEKYHTG
jgi:transposase